MKPIFLLILAILLPAVFSACTDDNPDISRPEPPANGIDGTITRPGSGEQFLQSGMISFAGSAMQTQSIAVPAESLNWVSSLQGTIGRSSAFTRSGLLSGEHQIQLQARYDGGLIPVDTVAISILPAAGQPAAIINIPPAGTRIRSHDLLALNGTVEMPSADVLTYTWTSNIDGVLGNGPAIVPGGLTAGLHVISLTAVPTDSALVPGSAAIEVLVEFDNSPAIEADILAPPDGHVFSAGTPITFSGSAQTDQGELISGSDLVWTSGMDGEFGLGESCIIDDFQPGFHRITMTVSGSGGRKTAVSIGIVVLP